jgi:hypothetical protein
MEKKKGKEKGDEWKICTAYLRRFSGTGSDDMAIDLFHCFSIVHYD